MNLSMLKIKSGALKYGKQFVGFMQKNSPTVLSATAVVGFVGSMVCLWKSKTKIENDIETRKLAVKIAREESEDEESEARAIKNANKYFAKNVAKHTAPTLVMSTITVASIIASVKIGNKRLAAVSAAYTLLDQNSKEWKEKAREILGDSKVRKVDEAWSDDKLKGIYPEEDEIIATNHGQTLFYDSWSGRYFKSSIEFIRRVINDMNYRLISEEWLDLNEFYYHLGLESIKAGSMVGWNLGQHGQIEDPKLIPRIVERNGVEETVILLNYDCHLREQYF